MPALHQQAFASSGACCTRKYLCWSTSIHRQNVARRQTIYLPCSYLSLCFKRGCFLRCKGHWQILHLFFEPHEVTSWAKCGALLAQRHWAGWHCPSSTCPFPAVNVQPAFGARLTHYCTAPSSIWVSMAPQQQILFFWKAWIICFTRLCLSPNISYSSQTSFYSCGLNPCILSRHWAALLHEMPCWAKLMSARDRLCKLWVYITHTYTHTKGALCLKCTSTSLYSVFDVTCGITFSGMFWIHMGNKRDFLQGGCISAALAKLPFPMSWWGLLGPGGIGGMSQWGQESILVPASRVPKISVGKWLPFCSFCRLFPVRKMLHRHPQAHYKPI